MGLKILFTGGGFESALVSNSIISRRVNFYGAAQKNDTIPTATIGFEAKLWLAADKLCNNMDAAEYKHVVLGLIAFPVFGNW